MADFNKSQGTWGRDASLPGILQVVSNSYDEAASTTSTSLTQVDGVSAAITPSSTSSKIYVQIMASCSVSSSNNLPGLGIKRDSTNINISDEAAGSRVNVTAGFYTNSDNSVQTVYVTALDSPNTTSEVEYYLTFRARSGYTTYVNRTGGNANAAYTNVPLSTITLMEVKGD